MCETFNIDVPAVLVLPHSTYNFPGGSNGVIGYFPHINSIAPASQDLHSGENWFHQLFWRLNSPARASQHLLRV